MVVFDHTLFVFDRAMHAFDLVLLFFQLLAQRDRCSLQLLGFVLLLRQPLGQLAVVQRLHPIRQQAGDVRNQALIGRQRLRIASHLQEGHDGGILGGQEHDAQTK